MNEQKTIVIVLHQEVSAYHATFKLARELSGKGFRIVYAGDSSFQRYAVAQGFEYKVIEADPGFIQQITASQKSDPIPQGTFEKKRYDIRLKNERKRKLSQHLSEKAEKWLEKERPVLALIGQACMYNSIPFLKKGVLFAGLDTNLGAPINLRVPPVFTKTIPPRRLNPATYLRNLAGWLKIYARLLFKETVEFLSLCYGFGIFQLSSAHSEKKVIKKYGGKVQWWEYGRLRLKVPGIVMCPIAFDFPFVRETAHRCYVGASVDKKRMNQPFDWDTIDEKKTLIYCSVGSHPDYCKDRMRLFRAVIEAMRQRPGLQGIIQVSDKTERESLEPLPENVVTVEWVPQLDVLARAHIFITHGGMSSIRESLYSGVPMIIFPWGIDQAGNSARIVFHHLGLRGNIKRVTPEIAGDCIDKLCGDPSYYRSVKQMQEVFLEQEDCIKGVDFIESMISSNIGKNVPGAHTQPRVPAERVVVEI